MRIGTPNFIGERLKEAREARALTCSNLAEMLGLGRSSVSNYENGLQTPSPLILERLSSILRVRPHYFTRRLAERKLGPKAYRSFNSATKRALSSSSRRYEWFHDIADYLNRFVTFPKVDVPNFASGESYRDLSEYEIEDIADETRRFWKLSELPISNMIWLLENKGVVCCRFPFGSTKSDAFSLWSDERPFVVLSTDKSSCVRSRFDAAHELAHLVLHRHVDQEQEAEYNRFSFIERQASRFAGALLMPEATFSEDFLPSLDVLRELKRKWLVSISAMIVRARQLELIDEDSERRLWVQMGRRKWRTREPFDDQLEPESPAFISRSITLLEDKGISSVSDIAFQLGLMEHEIAEICGLDGDRFPNLHNQANNEPGGDFDNGEFIIQFPK